MKILPFFNFPILTNWIFSSERDHHPFDEQQIHHLFEFLESLANSTYNTLKYLHTTQDIDELLAYFNIKPENYLSLIYNLTVDRSLKDINDVDNPAKIRATSGLQVVNSRLILTEFGLCYLFNSKLSSEYSANYMIRGGELQSMIDNLSQSDKYIGTRASNFFASVNNYNILGLDSGTALYVSSKSLSEEEEEDKDTFCDPEICISSSIFLFVFI